MIKVASCTIEDLFSEKIKTTEGVEICGTLDIPEYQRPYVWSEKEIEKLLLDIKEYNEDYINKQGNVPMYYLGSIILHEDEYKKKKILSIIDGQQRITTLAIIQYIKDPNNVPKLVFISPTTTAKIKENYDYLKKNKGLLKDISFNNLNVTLVVTKKEDDAYTFFETQNTGGVRLSGIDIIKAHHLRVIIPNEKRDEKYARTWEKQKKIDTVIEQLIKARRWDVLNWEDVPSYRDEKGMKETIIEDFSEKTSEEPKNSYPYAISTDNYLSIKISPHKFAIRQPLANGENFIDYLEQFAGLYDRLFNSDFDADAEICEEYYKFNITLIKFIDGTAFLKEFYEIAILCYVNKFGVENLLEACYWIFRYTYSLRVIKKIVRENTITNYINVKRHYLFDIIIGSFNHKQLIGKLKQYRPEFEDKFIDENSVRTRFIQRVELYFNFSVYSPVNCDEFDMKLTERIDDKLNEAAKLKGKENGK